MSKCVDCEADTSKQGWSNVPGKGELCNPCHDKWLNEKEDANMKQQCTDPAPSRS